MVLGLRVKGYANPNDAHHGTQASTHGIILKIRVPFFGGAPRTTSTALWLYIRPYRVPFFMKLPKP